MAGIDKKSAIDIKAVIDWIGERIEIETRLGNEYAEYAMADNGLMSVTHFQRAAAFRVVLHRLKVAITDLD